MSYNQRTHFQAPSNPRSYGYPETESTCTQCNATFRFWPKSYAQANTPRRSRPLCTPCFKQWRMQQEIADRERWQRIQREEADRKAAEEAAKKAEAERVENEAIADLRTEFDAQPDEFFRKFLRMTEEMEELSAKLRETSERVEELTSLSERVSQIERAMRSVSYNSL
jgi:hypothetical protein